jgi:hypothetical protein
VHRSSRRPNMNLTKLMNTTIPRRLLGHMATGGNAALDRDFPQSFPSAGRPEWVNAILLPEGGQGSENWLIDLGIDRMRENGWRDGFAGEVVDRAKQLVWCVAGEVEGEDASEYYVVGRLLTIECRVRWVGNSVSWW